VPHRISDLRMPCACIALVLNHCLVMFVGSHRPVGSRLHDGEGEDLRRVCGAAV
jgi:hypothetical protein